jgi:hypothetical protein
LVSICITTITMPSLQTITITPLPWNHPDSIQLRTTQRAEVDEAVLLLETGVLMGNARRFYEQCGYVSRKVFEGYSEADSSVYCEKRLDLSLVAPALLDGHDVKGLDG